MVMAVRGDCKAMLNNLQQFLPPNLLSPLLVKAFYEEKYRGIKYAVRGGNNLKHKVSTTKPQAILSPSLEKGARVQKF